MNATNSWISSASTFDNAFPKVEVLSGLREYDGYFKIDKVEIVLEKFDRRSKRRMVRYVIERGDAAAIIVHDPVLKRLAFVRQYRHPATIRSTNGWMLEIVAGSVKPGEDPAEIARIEVWQELGLETPAPEPIGSFFMSPGGMSEQCFMYHVAIDSSGLNGRLTGEKGTDEDVCVEVHSFEESMNMIRDGRLVDGKSIIAVQWIALGLVPGWPAAVS